MSTQVQSTPVNANLVLASGSRSGLKTPLMPGYYMIGRHSECQIRPKSKSVSRRHCLVHHQGSGVRVLDMDSTCGTTLNDQRIAPKCWVDLKAGDLLRLGKIGFHFEMDQTELAEPGDAKSGTASSMLTGEAWDTFDIAGFLDSADEADREKRYAKIRSEHQKKSDRDALEQDTLAHTNSPSKFITSNLSADNNESALTEVPSDRPTSSRTKAEARLKSQATKTKSKGSRLTSSFSGLASAMTSEGEDADRWKLILSVIFALAVLGFAAHKAYQFTSGPPLRVLHEIDS